MELAGHLVPRIVVAMILFPAVAVCTLAETVGPAPVAISDRARWPEMLSSRPAFDRASRAEILSFTAAVVEMTALDESSLRAALGVRKINPQSIRRWRDETGRRLLENYRHAAESCSRGEPFCSAAGSETELRGLAAALDASLPEAYRSWRNDARQFHRVYAAEQLRLAALFPAPTSEILAISPFERTGFELDDRKFLLTFDDGPTAAGGATDTTLAVLRRTGVNGIFFLLGERLQARQRQEPAGEASKNYSGMCVAGHGWTHESHEHLADWRKSVDDTSALLRQMLGPLYRPLFRPPYGERRPDSAGALAARGATVVLWNIDSQDWNPQIPADEVSGRVLSLMLLWRRGIVLFHDVYNKALVAVPHLVDQTRNAGITWIDCHRYPE